MRSLKHHKDFNKRSNFLSFEKKFKRLRHLYTQTCQYIQVHPQRKQNSHMFEHLASVHVSYFMHVPTTPCSECKFSLKEKTPPAANVRTSSTAFCLTLSPGSEGGAGILTVRQKQRTSKLGHFKDSA